MLTFKYLCENESLYDSEDLVALITRVLVFVDALSTQAGSSTPLSVKKIDVRTFSGQPNVTKHCIYKMNTKGNIGTLILYLPVPRDTFSSDLEAVVGMTKGETPRAIQDSWAEEICRCHPDWDNYARVSYVAGLEDKVVRDRYEKAGLTIPTGWRSGRLNPNIYMALLRESLQGITDSLKIRFRQVD